MRKLVVLAFGIIAASHSASAQETIDKLAGNWNETDMKNNMGIALKDDWSFSKNGTGYRTHFSRIIRPTTTCTVTQQFDFTLSGDSIKIMPHKATANCSLESENADKEADLANRAASKYSTTPETLLLQFDGQKTLHMGTHLLSKQ